MISHALARAAVDFARERGARALEGYPMITEGEEFIVGSRSASPTPDSPRNTAWP